jgi:epoxyqueuosine reductase
MDKRSDVLRRTRRQFLKGLTAAGALACFGTETIRPQSGKTPAATATDFDFRFRTISTAHLADVQKMLAGLEKRGRLSSNQTYLKYIHSFVFEPPKTMADARSIIVMSIPQKLAKVTFHPDGKARDVFIPCGYTDDGLTLNDVQEAIRRKILNGRAAKLERSRLPLKTMAVRSGLAEYGRNNISFVEGYGSFHQLLAFYTDAALADQWGPLKSLRLCKGCSICRKECPTGAIREGEENFVIDAGKCLTLYNELGDPIPSWIPAGAHHALAGCLKCQYPCPANEDVIGQVETLADFNAAETADILSGRADKPTQEAIAAKLKRFSSAQDYAYFSRNLKLALAGSPYPKPA